VLLARSAVDLDQMFRPPLPDDFHHGLLGLKRTPELRFRRDPASRTFARDETEI
jgi:hypothetical protein